MYSYWKRSWGSLDFDDENSIHEEETSISWNRPTKVLVGVISRSKLWCENSWQPSRISIPPVVHIQFRPIFTRLFACQRLVSEIKKASAIKKKRRACTVHSTYTQTHTTARGWVHSDDSRDTRLLFFSSFSSSVYIYRYEAKHVFIFASTSAATLIQRHRPRRGYLSVSPFLWLDRSLSFLLAYNLPHARSALIDSENRSEYSWPHLDYALVLTDHALVSHFLHSFFFFLAHPASPLYVYAGRTCTSGVHRTRALQINAIKISRAYECVLPSQSCKLWRGKIRQSLFFFALFNGLGYWLLLRISDFYNMCYYSLLVFVLGIYKRASLQ